MGVFNPLAPGISEARGDARYQRTIAPKTVSANYTATVDDEAILVDASGGARTISLPTAASVPGHEFYIQKTDASTNSLTTDPAGSETIQLVGSAAVTTASTDVQGDVLRIKSDGINRWVEIQVDAFDIDGLTQQAGDARYPRRVSTIAALKSLSASELVDGAVYSAKNHLAGYRGGGGDVYWDASITSRAFTSDAATNLLTVSGSSPFRVGEPVKLYGGSLGSGLTAGTTYYVTAVTARQASRPYTLGQMVTQGGRLYEVTTAGTSAASVPGTMGSTTTGQTVTDGGVLVWTDRGVAPGVSDFQLAPSAKEAKANPATYVNITSNGSGTINYADDGGTIFEHGTLPEHGRFIRPAASSEKWKASWFGVISGSGERSAELLKAMWARAIQGGGLDLGPGIFNFNFMGDQQPANVVVEGDAGFKGTWVIFNGDGIGLRKSGNANTIQGTWQPGGWRNIKCAPDSSVSTNQIGLSNIDGSRLIMENVEITGYNHGYCLELGTGTLFAQTYGTETCLSKHCYLSGKNPILFSASDPNAGSFSDLNIENLKVDIDQPNSTIFTLQNGVEIYSATIQGKVQNLSAATGLTVFKTLGLGTGAGKASRARLGDSHLDIGGEFKTSDVKWVDMADYDMFRATGQLRDLSASFRGTYNVPSHAVCEIGQPAISPDRANTDVTLVGPGADEYTIQRYATTLTADRNVTLPPIAAMRNGEFYEVWRDSSALSEFKINVKDASAVTLQSLRVPDSRIRATADNGAWRISSYVSSDVIDKRITHTTDSFILGNHDWSNRIYRQRSVSTETYAYNATNKGMDFTNSTGVADTAGFFIRMRVPVDPEATYYGRVKASRKSGAGRIYLGAVCLDKDYNVVTDSQPYRYFIANFINMSTVASYYFEGTIGGEDVASGVDYTKFAIGTKYVDFYLSTNESSTLNPRVTTVEWLEFKKLPAIVHQTISQPYSSGTLNINSVLADRHRVSITGGNVTAMTITSLANSTTTAQDGKEIKIEFIQDATGNRSIAFPSNVKLAGGAFVTSGPNKRDSITLLGDGTNWNEVGRSMNVG